MMKERVFRYGENNRGLGMLTVPDIITGAPVVVMLNAGLLHRAEPYRLNVLACRRLAEIGYICLRVDLAGKGDTPARKGFANRESVDLDWRYIKQALEQQFGKRFILIMGICSGADNGIKIAAQDTDVKGLILMDVVSKKDRGFARRNLANKFFNFYNWTKIPRKIIQIINNLFRGKEPELDNDINLRDEPNDQDLWQCCTNLTALDGRILAVFTSYTLSYYNKKGQFSRTMEVPGLEQICEEIFWPNVDHTFKIEAHRDRLLALISKWCETHFDRFRLKEATI
jgi:hypothetical protein